MKILNLALVLHPDQFLKILNWTIWLVSNLRFVPAWAREVFALVPVSSRDIGGEEEFGGVMPGG